MIEHFLVKDLGRAQRFVVVVITLVGAALALIACEAALLEIVQLFRNRLIAGPYVPILAGLVGRNLWTELAGAPKDQNQADANDESHNFLNRRMSIVRGCS
jgi:hypothetical protein